MAEIDLSSALGAAEAAFLAEIGAAAKSFRANSYIVGGVVRDALMSLRSPDIDVMLEGDAVKFLQFIRREWSRYFSTVPAPENVVAFERYGTGKLIFGKEIFAGVQSIDFSSARSETYPEPAQAPLIGPGDLASDLARRDFSVNAMAIELSPNNIGLLHDLFSGAQHVAEKQLVVLHEQSFVDDPARMIRGVRLIGRYQFEFSAATRELFNRAWADRLLLRLPVTRLFDELKKGLADPNVADVIAAFFRYRLLEQIEPRLVRPAVPIAEPTSWSKALCALSLSMSDGEFRAMLNRFFVSKRVAAALFETRRELQT